MNIKHLALVFWVLASLFALNKYECKLLSVSLLASSSSSSLSLSLSHAPARANQGKKKKKGNFAKLRKISRNLKDCGFHKKRASISLEKEAKLASEIFPVIFDFFFFFLGNILIFIFGGFVIFDR